MAERITARDYTRGFAFGEVLGRIGNWRPWWGPASLLQYASALASFLVLVRTWGLWARLPGPVSTLVLLAVPVALFVATGRRSRIDGRSPASVACALTSFLAWHAATHARAWQAAGRRRWLAGTWVWTRTGAVPGAEGEGRAC